MRVGFIGFGKFARVRYDCLIGLPSVQIFGFFDVSPESSAPEGLVFDSKSDALTLAPTTCCSPGDLKQNQTSSKSPLRVLLNWQFHERFSTQSKFATVSQTSVSSLIT